MKKIIYLFFAILFTLTPVFAVVDTTKVSIQEAVSIASKNNLDIQSSRKNIERAEQNIKEANKLNNPAFGAFFNLGKAGKGDPQQIGVSQLIEVGKRGARKDLNKSIFELVSRNVEYLEFDLRMDVRESYTNLLARKSNLTTMREQEDLLSKMLEQAKKKHKMGKASEIDVLQAQLLLNQIKAEVYSTEYAVKTALYDFNKVINCPDGFYDTIENSFTNDYMPLTTPSVNDVMPDFESISAKAINNRFDIKIALQEIEVAEKELTVIMRKRIPDFEIQGGYSYKSRNQSDTSVFENGAFVGFNIVNIPILYTFKPEIKNAKLKLEQAHLNYSSVENKALNDLRKTYEKFLTAQLTLRNYNEHLLVDSKELIDVSRKSYVNGKTDLTTLISMEESYRMISVSYTNALASYYNAWNAFIREVNNEMFTIDTEEL